MTFAKWLRKQKRRTGPIGDLARDVAADECNRGPGRVGRRMGSTWNWWLKHITTAHTADPTAIEALKNAAREYQFGGFDVIRKA
jgi:hypothetical protein